GGCSGNGGVLRKLFWGFFRPPASRAQAKPRQARNAAGLRTPVTRTTEAPLETRLPRPDGATWNREARAPSKIQTAVGRHQFRMKKRKAPHRGGDAALPRLGRGIWWG